MTEPLDGSAYRAVFQETAFGQQVLEELSAMFYDIESYARNEPHHTSYLEGQRAVMRHIIWKLGQLPDRGEEDDIQA